MLLKKLKQSNDEHRLVNPTRKRFSALRRWLHRSSISPADWDQLEEILISADLGPALTMELLDELRELVKIEGVKGLMEAHTLLMSRLTATLEAESSAFPSGNPPQVVFMVGVNGVGKTTSIAKLAHLLRNNGYEVMLAAGDTFRAGAIDQLNVWGDRIDVPVIAHEPGSDPGAVIYDALEAAKARGTHYVIADSAGRQHTNLNLMNELTKMHRVAARKIPGAPHEVLLVLDALTGQNGLEQARKFVGAVNVTGIVLTKLDSSAKGGVAFAVTRETGVPIKFVGNGESLDDFEAFDPKSFVHDLLEPGPEDNNNEEAT